MKTDEQKSGKKKMGDFTEGNYGQTLVKVVPRRPSHNEQEQQPQVKMCFGDIGIGPFPQLK